MGLEREPWLDLSSFPEEDHVQYGPNSTYSSEELQVRVSGENDEQRVLDMSNPSARATGITVSQYLGLDLDIASETQLSILMDMHMEVGTEDMIKCRQLNTLLR